MKCNVKKTIRKFLPFFIHPYTFDPLSKIVNRSERVRGKKPARELARTSVDGKWWRRGFRLDFSQAMRWRGGSMQRGWKLLGRGDDAYDVDNDHGRDHHLDQKGNRIQIERDIPPPFALTYSTFSRRSRKDMARLQTGINIPTLSLSLTFRKDKNVLSFNRLVN